MYVDDPISSMIQAVQTSMFVQYLENITSFGPRVAGTEANKEAAAYIYQTFQDLGLDVRYDPFSIIGQEFNGTNIEATLNGANSMDDHIYIICGHYDTVVGSPGADDNGGAIAAMLSIATVIRQYPFNYTIRFVAFDDEESGLHGSLHYVQDAVEHGASIAGVLNADMICNTDTNEGERTVVLFNDRESEWLFEYALTISATYDEDIPLTIEDCGYTAGSDHIPFWSYGYSALCVSEFDFSPYYHSSKDTIEHVNPSYATNVTRLMLAIVTGLAGYHQNGPPNVPAIPSGPTNGKHDTDYSYVTSTTDPEGDQVYYWFDWGDGTTSGWLGPYGSGIGCEATHQWNTQGEFTIRVKAKDGPGLESDWATLRISMPKVYSSHLMFQTVMKLMERVRFLSQSLEEHSLMYD